MSGISNDGTTTPPPTPQECTAEIEEDQVDDETDTTETEPVSRPLTDTDEGTPNANANANSNPLHSLTTDSVYDFYVHELFPALLSSFPILADRLRKDAIAWALLACHKFVLFVQPKWMNQQLLDGNGDGDGTRMLLSGEHEDDWRRSPNALAQQLWEHTVQSTKNVNATIADFMLSHFDKDDDGHISPNELLNMTDLLAKLPTVTNPRFMIQTQRPVESFWAWFSREWPLMDWKIGVFLWQTFGGILLVIAVLSVMPGRLHTWSAKMLRWPILGLTYLLINIELIVYIAIRLVIRIIETLVATPKHRALRHKMANASSSYEEWYKYAAELDESQKRTIWQSTTTDETSYQYNWPLIQQLLDDMREARVVKQDPLLALAVLQQCTRKNVGGIMDEDLFTKTYTGQPKFIVMEFIDEVTKTLAWVTDQTLLLEKEATVRAEAAERHSQAQRKSKKKEKRTSRAYDRHFRETSDMERDKLWRSLVEFVTFDFGASENNKDVEDDVNVDADSNAPEILESRSSNSQSTNASPIPQVTTERLLRFLKRARNVYGKTALCLSGGSMMGLYHIGHLKGLMETDCLPGIVSGCSAGSAIGAILCTRTNDELSRDLDPEVIGPHLHCFDRSWPDRAKSVWKTGNIFSGEDWLKMIKWFSNGDMTFEEAYQKTGRVLCVALAATAKKTPPILINYISAPNVTIASAVVASAAVPGFVSPQQLQCKDPDGTVRSAGPETYFDGSIRHDIPTAGLSEMLNCHFFVACQCNPHIVPFFFNAKGGVGRPSRWSGGEQETSWRGGFLLAALEMYLKNDMKAKFVFLRDLDAAVSFTGTMMTQSFVGTTTIVPQVELRDFFVLFSDPSISRLYHYLKVGAVAAYQHAAMIRCHYRISDALEESIEKLEAYRNDNANADANSNTAKGSSSIFVNTPGETPRKKRVSRRGSFHDSDTASGTGESDARRLWKKNQQQQHAQSLRDRIPEIITSNSHLPRDGDSVSTSSETYGPTTP